MKKLRVLKNVALYSGLIVCVVFLFIGGPPLDASRSTYHIWDLGHILLFALLTFFKQLCYIL